MTTSTSTTAAASRKGQARHRDLETMLRDREREMQDTLRRRARPALAAGRGDGLDEPELIEADVQAHIEVALIQIKGETLARVRQALARLDQGEYGYCTECDGEISAQRLRALPFAVRCTACEELHERGAAQERRSASATVFHSVFSDQMTS
jgi:DnaK suppressor protein